MTQPESYEDAAERAANYLYSIPDDCPKELRVPIGQLRQMINEEFVHKGKSVSSQLIWDMLKPGIAQQKREAYDKGYNTGWVKSKRLRPDIKLPKLITQIEAALNEAKKLQSSLQSSSGESRG